MSWRPLPGAGPPEPRRVGESLPAVTRNLAGPDGVHLVQLVSTWPEVVGPSVASHSRPLRLAAHTLTIAVDQPGWATELTYLEAQLRARVDAALGPGVVTSVKVVVRPR
jgi:predicted nucleic acid-binding Zn ribbon protein